MSLLGILKWDCICVCMLRLEWEQAGMRCRQGSGINADCGLRLLGMRALWLSGGWVGGPQGGGAVGN